MNAQDRQRRNVAILQFVRDNVPFLPESAHDLYPQARMCKEIGLYSKTTFIGDIARRLWWLRKDMPSVDQERSQRIALAAPDLLAACKEALDYIRHDEDGEVVRDLRSLLSVAIRKAEGGAS